MVSFEIPKIHQQTKYNKSQRNRQSIPTITTHPQKNFYHRHTLPCFPHKTHLAQLHVYHLAKKKKQKIILKPDGLNEPTKLTD